MIKITMIIYINTTFRLFFSVIFLLCLWFQTPVLAQFYKNKGIVEGSNIPYQSLTVLSDNKKASLTFYCDEGASYPRISFKRSFKISKAGDAFMLRYVNDRGIKDQHNFLITKDENVGRFFIRHVQLYAERFGKQPDMFKKGTALFSQEYLNWDAHIRQAVLYDLVGGDAVDITIWSSSKQFYDYRFKTTGFKKLLPLLAPCLQNLTY